MAGTIYDWRKITLVKFEVWKRPWNVTLMKKPVSNIPYKFTIMCNHLNCVFEKIKH